ncbi:hypothetical protein KQX54_014038 [Cotesia glomerata]|uniref:CCHC-type domain-containing protein n=1 Tax=Cotesia glomerata TaxID=32391 RepID=A0AAV7I2H9_COTGL|nr:hypothetical protein KQX54_014038 [Cotesia glomerata]
MGPTRLERANVDKHQEYAKYMRTRLTEEASVSNPVKPITTANSGNSQIMSGATRQSSTEVSSAGTSSSDAQGNIDNLQTTIASVNALAAKLNSNDGLQNTTGGLLKEVVDRLCKVHSHMLEVEKSRLKNMQTPEQRGSGPSQEVSNSRAMPEVRRTDSAVISTTGKEMDMEALRKTMYRIQEDNDASKGRGVDKSVAASRVRVQKSKNNGDKCFRCNRTGHWQDKCPLNGTNKWACYVCNCITDHKSEDCPGSYKRRFGDNSNYEPPVKRNKLNPRQQTRGSNSRSRGSNFRGNPRGNIRGASNGNFRGVYERPNWVVRFEVVKPRCAENNLMSELEKYSCTACLTADNEVSKQSQTGQDNELSRSEGVNSESNDASMTDVGSAIGRESLEYLIVLDDSEKANSEKLKLDEQNSEGQTNQTPYKTKDSSGESKLDKIAEFTVSDETMEVENLEVKTIEPKKRGRPKKSNPDVNNKVSEKQNKKKISDLPTNNIDGPVNKPDFRQHKDEE